MWSTLVHTVFTLKGDYTTAEITHRGSRWQKWAIELPSIPSQSLCWGWDSHRKLANPLHWLQFPWKRALTSILIVFVALMTSQQCLFNFQSARWRNLMLERRKWELVLLDVFGIQAYRMPWIGLVFAWYKNQLSERFQEHEKKQKTVLASF